VVTGVADGVATTWYDSGNFWGWIVLLHATGTSSVVVEATAPAGETIAMTIETAPTTISMAPACRRRIVDGVNFILIVDLQVSWLRGQSADRRALRPAA